MKKDPNNAYGSKAAREKALRGVSADIRKRDLRDTRRETDYLPYYDSDGNYQEHRVGKAPTKLEAMAFVDASRRLPKQGVFSSTPREMRDLGKKGEAEAKALRKPTKKAPASKMPSSAESAASGDRMSRENAKDAKAVAATTPSKKPTAAELATARSAARVSDQEGDERRKMGMKHGGAVKKYAKGGSVTRGDGIVKKGHTKGRII
jgi:hypothetical protein